MSLLDGILAYLPDVYIKPVCEIFTKAPFVIFKRPWSKLSRMTEILERESECYGEFAQIVHALTS
jgi:hypothetical protein